jgi:hypothetical protein
MAGPRTYARSTLMALTHLSGGLCYYPGCPEQVLREVENDIYGIADIAHIKAAYPNGARYDPSMTDDQRRNLNNLMLLCELCRRRHNVHYADLRIMPILFVLDVVGAGQL